MGKLKREVVKEIKDTLLFNIHTGKNFLGTVKFIADKDKSHITEVIQYDSSTNNKVIPIFRYTKEEFESSVKDSNVFCGIRSYNNKKYYVLHNALYNNTLSIPVTEKSYLNNFYIIKNVYLAIYDFGEDVLTFLVDSNNMTIINNIVYSKRLDEIIKSDYLENNNLNEIIFLAKSKIDKMEKEYVKIKK